MRPALDWNEDEPIEWVRKTTTNEARKMASLPESYLDFLAETDPSDAFAYESINMGVPVNTVMAMNKAAIQVLTNAKVMQTTPQREGCGEQRTCNSAVCCTADEYEKVPTMKHECQSFGMNVLGTHSRGAICSKIQSIQVDTGTDATLLNASNEANLTNATEAQVTILVADNTASMPASLQGDMRCIVLNAGENPDIPQLTDWVIPTCLTVPRARRQLLSIEDFYKQKGYELHLRQPENGPSELENISTGGSTRIPVRHDSVKGGFWIDFIPYEEVKNRPKDVTEESWLMMQLKLAQHEHIQQVEANKPFNKRNAEAHTYSAQVANSIMRRASCNAAVRKVIISRVVKQPDGTEKVIKSEQRPDPAFYAQHPDEREVKGIKTALKDKKKKMLFAKFHETHGHLGSCPNCKVCRMIKGASVMRRISKVYDPYKPRLPGYAWDMDMIVLSDRSMENYKYLIVLKCRSTGYIALLPLVHKYDAWGAVAEWIRSLRNDPLYQRYSYDMVQHIQTDADGSWRYDNADWQTQIVKKLGVKMQYISPDRHESNGRAERAISIVEVTTKAILMQNNLAPDWWYRAAKDAEFLLNRFPPVATDTAVSLDGDRPRPLELFTESAYSRRQIDRELAYFVPVGTPCMVHDTHALGSTIGPKVRWGIALGMHREVVEFMCPFVRSHFRNKSYVAYPLTEGQSYGQFLGLKPQSSYSEASPTHTRG